MNAVRIVAALLLIGGILALIYGGFNYTKSTQEAQMGPLELTVQDKQRVSVPVWAGVSAILIGGVLLLFPSKNR